MGDDEAYNVIVGKNISKMRDLYGLTQEELARALASSLQQVRDYENGVHPVPPAKLFQLANMFQCSIDNLFGIRILRGYQ